MHQEDDILDRIKAALREGQPEPHPKCGHFPPEPKPRKAKVYDFEAAKQVREQQNTK